MRTGLDVTDRRPSDQLQRLVVRDLAVADDAAVAVRGVFAQAYVGEEDEGAAVERAERALDDPVVVVCAGALVVLLFRDAEQDHGAHAEALEPLRLDDDRLDRVPCQPRQVVVRERLGPDEQGHNEVVEVEARLADEVADAARAPQPSQPRDGERAHVNNLRVANRASAPKRAPRPTSHRSSRPTVRHGLVS